MSTKTTAKKPRSVGPRTIDALPVTDAHNAALAFLQRHRLLGDLDADAILAIVHAVRNTGEAMHLSTLGALLDEGRSVLERSAGMAQISRFLTPKAAETAHQHRSALAVMTAAAALAFGADPYPYLRALPILKPRHGGPDRPIADDEVLLLRLWAVHQSRLGPRNRAALFHLLLTDAGSRPSENTQIKPIHLNDLSEPTHIDLPGVYSVVGARRIPLPEWVRPFLRAALRDHLARDVDARTRGLTYNGSAAPGGHIASASASGVFARAMRDAGIDSAPGPLSLVRWRLSVTETQHGIRTAQTHSGYDKIDTMVNFIGDRYVAASDQGGCSDYAIL